MVLPNAEHAVVEIRKLVDYCLDARHDEGKHKARLFAAVGITAKDAEELRHTLLQAVKTNEAYLGRRDAYGQRYIVDFLLDWKGKQAMIRSGWIIEHGTNTPRLTTCYPL
jgi:Domain of unknown function (DUF6883)